MSSKHDGIIILMFGYVMQDRISELNASAYMNETTPYNPVNRASNCKLTHGCISQPCLYFVLCESPTTSPCRNIKGFGHLRFIKSF